MDLLGLMELRWEKIGSQVMNEDGNTRLYNLLCRGVQSMQVLENGNDRRSYPKVKDLRGRAHKTDKFINWF